MSATPLNEPKEPLERLKMLKQKAQSLPHLPGVYLMKDRDNQILYIGKALSLKDRVSSYFGSNSGDGRAQIPYLISKIESLDTIVTQSEQQAFILEADLIKRYKPRYNIRLKDDKAYLNVRIDLNQEWPRLELVRRVEQDGANYFGPYTKSAELRKVLEVIRATFPLRSCSDAVLYNRQRPCLEYEIKRCSGPCCLEVSKDSYSDWLKQAQRLLEGKTSQVIKALDAQMERASEELRFEEAAWLRDKIEVLSQFAAGNQLVSFRSEMRDVFALERQAQLACLAVLIVRDGRIVDSLKFALKDIQVSDDELLEGAISQFYASEREVPEEILISVLPNNWQMIQAGLSEQRGSSCELSVPERGVRYRLLGIAKLNAEQGFIDSFEAQARSEEVLRQLAKLLSVKANSAWYPKWVECIDISNFQGSNIVASSVAFINSKPAKQHYRHYKLSFQGDPDDFGAINEIVKRRLQRAQLEDSWPDLIIIDGGSGQLAAALKARDELQQGIEIISLAKRRIRKGRKQLSYKPERIFLPGVEKPIALEPGKGLTNFMEQIRDEAHRFAITYHRKLRDRSTISSRLDSIDGVGPAIRERLLKKFKSVANISKLDAVELAKKGAIPQSLALRILNELCRDI